MKKLVALLTVAVMLVCSFAIYGSAADSVYLSEQTIPYATTAPTLDGKLDEWKKAAKFTGDTSNLKAVDVPGLVTTVTAGYSQNIYMMWDETYLYVATEVTDTNNGRLVYGADGDNLSIMYDFDGVLGGLQNAYDHSEVNIPNIEGVLNMSNFMTYCFPVTAALSDNNAIGYHTRYGTADHEAHAPNPETPNLTGDESACSSNGNSWIIEQKIKWSDLSALFTTVYGSYSLVFPEIKAGTVVTFMTSYHDCGATNACIGWYIGQNKIIDTPQATPYCYGYKGTLGAKPSADTADSTLTAGIVVSAIALAGVTVALNKKKH